VPQPRPSEPVHSVSSRLKSGISPMRMASVRDRKTIEPSPKAGELHFGRKTFAALHRLRFAQPAIGEGEVVPPARPERCRPSAPSRSSHPDTEPRQGPRPPREHLRGGPTRHRIARRAIRHESVARRDAVEHAVQRQFLGVQRPQRMVIPQRGRRGKVCPQQKDASRTLRWSQSSRTDPSLHRGRGSYIRDTAAPAPTGVGQVLTNTMPQTK
jgi:hypothetical protein